MRLLVADVKHSSRHSTSVSRRIVSGGKEGASDQNPPEKSDAFNHVSGYGLVHGNVVVETEQKSCPCNYDGIEKYTAMTSMVKKVSKTRKTILTRKKTVVATMAACRCR